MNLPTRDPSIPWIVALTGASGTIYGRRLLSRIIESHPAQAVDVIVSEAALRVLRDEEQIGSQNGLLEGIVGSHPPHVRLHSNRNIGATVASGSYRTHGMIVAPCSMKSLAAIACGYSESLIHRAADVTLKEQRRLILVPRETPLSQIHLENMLRLARMGVCIVPAMPGFYNRPESIVELVDTVVDRLLDLMGLETEQTKRWQG